MILSPSLLALLNVTKAEYTARYGEAPMWCSAAPGRVNLIGEHTDYNDGFVLPMAIERYTVIAAGPRDKENALVYSICKGEEAELKLDGSAVPQEKVVWSEYVQGAIQCAHEKGYAASPFNAVIHTDVPLGGGLSSSASLEVATATLIEAISDLEIEPTQKALLCQAAEHRFAKMPCGIMDQFISTMGQRGAAMLLDCRSGVPRMIPMDDPSVSVLIINSNVSHSLTGSEYPDRRRQCEKVAKMLGLTVLRDATITMLEMIKAQCDQMPDGDLCLRRARHVITENERTLAMADALAKKDWPVCGRLMYASHASMKDDFEITVPAIDTLVEIARNTTGVIGSRMTGGGFGGCTVSLVQSNQVDEIMNSICTEYEKQTGIQATAFATTPAQGAMILK